MPTIHLNDMQCFRLYQWFERAARGVTHLKRMQRLHGALDIERIERLFEKNQETIDAFQSDGKAVPRAALTVVRADEPTRAIELEAGDVDKIAAALDRKKKDLDAENSKGFDDPDDWRIWLPIFDEFETASIGYKEVSKSAATPPAGDGQKAKDARAPG